ncbi:MAG: hypothetical protein EB015_19895, partial [Methylocystaceae bacterium]|nr:hypothetical protein [Methylocystaceae bacterium]
WRLFSFVFPLGNPMIIEKYMPRKQAAEYVSQRLRPISPSNLATLAQRGAGPIFRFIGKRSYYLAADLDDWIVTQVSEPTRQSRKYEKRQAAE